MHMKTNSSFKLDKRVKTAMSLMYDRTLRNVYKNLMIDAQLEAAKAPPSIKEPKK